MIKIDASQGEGGGQVLRTALALSIITQQTIHLTHIRAKRSKPGLMRQHLTCVKAAQAISDAEVSGAELGSRELMFTPKAIRGGDYHFAIGTAGSCSLVLQTVLWPLLFADQESSVIIEGGTHVPMAPSFEFLEYSFFPVLRKMGVEVDLELIKHGFYPGGGGKLKATIKPWRAQRPLELTRRGDRMSQHALCLFANLEQSIADTQLAEVRRYLNWQEADVVHHGLRNSHGIGNALILSVQSSEYSEIVTSYGDKSRSSGQVAQVACDEMKRYLASPAAVGEHMADQLLIPLALVGGTFTCNVISQHFKTNCEIIQKFVAHRFSVIPKDAHCHVVEISQSLR